MYSDSRYSLARYSVNREEKTVDIRACFAEAMGVLAGAAVPVDIRGRFGEALRGTARGTVAIISVFPAGEGLFTAARMTASMSICV